MILYLAVSADKYELPFAVEDSPIKLANRVGKSARYVSSCIVKKTRVQISKNLYIRLIKINLEE